MALQNRGMVKNGIAQTTLSIQPPVGKSLLVRDILCAPVADKYLTVKIDRMTVGYFRVDTTPLGSHLNFALPDDGIKSILGYLHEKGIFTGYPVAEGQTLEISGLGSTAINGCIVYDEYDAGDITEDMPNGTLSSSYLFVNYGVVTANIATAVSTLYTGSSNPSEFPAFPFGASVPADTQIKLHGISASERSADDGTTAANNVLSSYYRFVRDRVVLFDSDRNGILAKGKIVGSGGGFEASGGQSILGDYTDLYTREPLMFPDPLIFGSGEEMDVYITTTVAGTPGTLLIAEAQIALILEVVKL